MRLHSVMLFFHINSGDDV